MSAKCCRYQNCHQGLFQVYIDKERLRAYYFITYAQSGLATWGNNSNGQLGDGTTNSRNTPAQLTTITGVIGVDAGYKYTIALRNDGTVWTWGINNKGQLGDGTTTDRSLPVPEATGLSTAPARVAMAWTVAVAVRVKG